jgi:hypothetical protein
LKMLIGRAYHLHEIPRDPSPGPSLGAEMEMGTLQCG